jgi:hypothetical protein
MIKAQINQRFCWLVLAWKDKDDPAEGEWFIYEVYPHLRYQPAHGKLKGNNGYRQTRYVAVVKVPNFVTGYPQLTAYPADTAGRVASWAPLNKQPYYCFKWPHVVMEVLGYRFSEVPVSIEDTRPRMRCGGRKEQKAELTPDDVRAIRESRETIRDLAYRYSRAVETIRRIKNGTAWAGVK